jgi:hypothetical protein
LNKNLPFSLAQKGGKNTPEKRKKEKQKENPNELVYFVN